MLPRALIGNNDQRRLRNILVALFLGLAIPTGVLIGQAFSQLKWESFYQYRVQAEGLTNRIDASIAAQINTAQARGIADFSFLAGDPSSKFVQRSPLAAWPMTQDIPGVIGYFQIDPDGKFSTPIVPAADQEPADVGLNAAEYSARLNLAGDIQKILAQNRLLRNRVAAAGLVYGEPEDVPPKSEALAAASAFSVPVDEIAEKRASDTAGVTLALEDDTPGYTQQGFDQLNQPVNDAFTNSADAERSDALRMATVPARSNTYRKVQDLQFDDELQKKSASLDRQLGESELEDKDTTENIIVRARRSEPSPMMELQGSIAQERELDSDIPIITAFESEIDPYAFSLLDSGHLVLFRNVWRDGERTIQGLLIDQDQFISAVIESAFRTTSLSAMSDLVIAYNDDVIRMLSGSSNRASPLTSSAIEMDGTLLHRSRLSAPFDALELIYTINRLPPGPGASVLAWTTVILAVVFLGGFLALYRLGLSQIRLARQQQDFVSAVSHELKTPLTSIRMYGEMLREGWADEAKRKQYYEYIHDESERLTRLISNVLQLANISRNEPEFKLTATTVAALMDQVRSKIASQVERAGFDFELVLDDAAANASVSVDDDCFTQIIINLVDNAIKFSKDAENKTIRVAGGLTSDNRVVISVRDYGPGIPKDQLKKIFSLFYRSESELTRETVGTGIGLAIVHQLTTAMNGRVNVINRDPGARFEVSFPAG